MRLDPAQLRDALLLDNITRLDVCEICLDLSTIRSLKATYEP